ncbi:MAG: hypothetical protein ACKOZW_00945 [Cyanobium sp.]
MFLPQQPAACQHRKLAATINAHWSQVLMHKARHSLMAFGLEMIAVVGLGFMIVPMPILHLFGLSAGDDVWIRFVGVLASIVGFYYLQVARSGLDPFIPWTVPARLCAAAFMLLLVVLKMVKPSLCSFAAIDITGAMWTWLALRSAKPHAAL